MNKTTPRQEGYISKGDVPLDLIGNHENYRVSMQILNPLYSNIMCHVAVVDRKNIVGEIRGRGPQDEYVTKTNVLGQKSFGYVHPESEQYQLLLEQRHEYTKNHSPINAYNLYKFDAE
jgi:hypothetical protein